MGFFPQAAASATSRVRFALSAFLCGHSVRSALSTLNSPAQNRSKRQRPETYSPDSRPAIKSEQHFPESLCEVRRHSPLGSSASKANCQRTILKCRGPNVETPRGTGLPGLGPPKNGKWDERGKRCCKSLGRSGSCFWVLRNVSFYLVLDGEHLGTRKRQSRVERRASRV
jgi:hypothetical protein